VDLKVLKTEGMIEELATVMGAATAFQNQYLT
jgi:hypothetical protein